jgi:hypothetical protein
MLGSTPVNDAFTYDVNKKEWKCVYCADPAFSPPSGRGSHSSTVQLNPSCF